MQKLRHGVGAFVMFAVIISLFIVIYDGLEDNYGITKGDTKTLDNLTTGNIVEQLRSMQIMEGVATITAGIDGLKPGDSSTFDIVGSLASVGVGVLKTTFGIFIFPYEIVRVLMGYYGGEIVGEISGIVALVIVYAGFIMLSAYLRHEV